MGPRREVLAERALLVIVWVTATMVAGAVTWGAVATFGNDGRRGPGAVLTEEDVRQLVAAGEPSPATPVSPSISDAAPSRPTSERPSAHATQHPTKSGPSTMSPTSRAHPSAPPTSSPEETQQPKPTHQPSTAPPVQTHSRSWSITGGNVGASCHEQRIALLYATPDDGWSLDVESSGPESIEVVFRRGESEAQLEATCVRGSPVAQIEHGDSGLDGGGEGEVED